MTAAELVIAGFAHGITPEARLMVSDWADSFRFLSSVASSEPGCWRTDRTPYLREVMDVLSPHHPAETVVMQAGAQLGKTEAGNNWLGYIMHRTPGPTLMVEPTVDVAKRVSKQRLAPMIEATPVLRELVRESRSRDSGNTMLMKEFPGGVLIVTGANSGAGLRSMPIRFLFMDEVDEYPGDVDGQGDPVMLAQKRTDTFARRKIFLTSTPTIRGLSRIERELLRSDHRRYFVPCSHCGFMDWIQWQAGGLHGNEGVHHHIHFTDHDLGTAAMACSSCGALTGEGRKSDMLARGEWRATAEGDGRTVGFHISALYSPLGWKSWASCVADFLSAKNDPFKLKAFVNTVLGETFEERGESVEAGALSSRLESYEAEVPHGVGILVASVDVQGDRLEAKVKGYGAGEESWLVAFTQILGDPANGSTWAQLDQFLLQPFTHASGRKVFVECATVDSGGHHTEHVYRYCKAAMARGRRVFPVKGSSVSGKPLVERPSNHNRYRVPLFMLCVDTGKEVVMSRLKVSVPGPGYVHLPANIADEEYLAQLTSEKSVRKYVKGRGAVREWVKVRDRNEALDLEVYALAALHICGQPLIRSLADRAAKWSAKAPGSDGPAPDPASPGTAAPMRTTQARRPGGKGWLNW